MQYDLEIEHIDGERNTVADALSRIAETLTDEEVKNLPTAQDIVEFPISVYNIYSAVDHPANCLILLDSFKPGCGCIQIHLSLDAVYFF